RRLGFGCTPRAEKGADFIAQFAYAGAGYAGREAHLLANGARESCALVIRLGWRHRVDLVERDELRLVREPTPISFEFTPHGAISFRRAFLSGVDQMHKRDAAFDVP